MGAIFDVEERLDRDPISGERSPQAHGVNMGDAAVQGTAEAFEPALRRPAMERDVPQATKSSVTADGAESIWNLGADYFPASEQIVDWYHACEHLHQAASALYKEDEKRAERWFKERKESLFLGEIQAITKPLDQAGLSEQTRSYWGLITFYASVCIPLATWMLKGYFDSIPIELEEQAMIDSATRLEVIRLIVMPLALPGIAAVSIYTFLVSWNEFMAALTILQKQELRTLPVQIINFVGHTRLEWGPVMAYSIIIGLPVALLFALVQRHLVGRLTAGFAK